ncbi:MAG: RagB/SusD family nutrient uptake outer membrane protein [Mucilaginibacter sp.]|nr:RagB/SusD family nutrient uptake outer membrane protein [Mucilaginibacter sp.]
MKKLNLKLSLPLVVVILVSTFYACKKNFLTQVPIGKLSPAVVGNAAGVNGLLIGAYSLLDGVGGNGGGIDGAASNWLFGGVAAGDAYKGSQPSDGGADALPVGNYTYDTGNPYITSRYDVLFAGISRANDVLRTIPLAKDMSATAAAEAAGEAKFLRAFYYLELRKQYGHVPYIDETVTDFNQPNTAEIWPKIEADFTASMNAMPGTQPNKGRANKYAAEAYLAKTYMFEHKFDAALPLFHDLITNGTNAQGQKYALNPIFQTNFSPEPSQKNSPESVFAAQTSVNDGAGDNNGNKGDELNFPYAANSPGSCCGWDGPSQWLGNSYKTDANGLPMPSTFNTVGGDVSNPKRGAVYTGNIDPRIDITMGRPNVPYLDWGAPQPNWIRDPTDGVFSPRKNVYSKSEKGTLSDATPGAWDNVEAVANNVNLMRYADLLLMAAECEIEAAAGSSVTAEADVALVRTRAANPAGWVYLNSAYSTATSSYTINATPADKYVVANYPAGSFSVKSFARTAIRFERKLELGMEGMRWYDLQRWDGASVTDPITTSDGSMAAEINAFFASDVSINSQLQGAHFTPHKNEYYAIPQQEIDRSRSQGKEQLIQNAGY